MLQMHWAARQLTCIGGCGSAPVSRYGFGSQGPACDLQQVPSGTIMLPENTGISACGHCFQTSSLFHHFAECFFSVSRTCWRSSGGRPFNAAVVPRCVIESRMTRQSHFSTPTGAFAGGFPICTFLNGFGNVRTFHSSGPSFWGQS